MPPTKRQGAKIESEPAQDAPLLDDTPALDDTAEERVAEEYAHVHERAILPRHADGSVASYTTHEPVAGSEGPRSQLELDRAP